MYRHFTSGGWLDAKAIAHNVVASVFLVVASSVGLMFWSYLQGQSGPWIAIAGVTGAGAVMFAIRQAKAIASQANSVAAAVSDTPVETECERQLRARVDELSNNLAKAREDAKRVDLVRTRLAEHAIRGRDVRTNAEMRSWMSAAVELVRGLAPRASHRLHVGFPPHSYNNENDNQPIDGQSLTCLEQSMASLQIIECNLQPQHLPKAA